jgi:threonine/homoserine/homoserine lactone efflux protein
MPEALLLPAIRWRSILPLLFTSLAVTGSPGPATVSLVAVGSVLGGRHALKYLIVILVGTTDFVVAVATGITPALVALPAIG